MSATLTARAISCCRQAFSKPKETTQQQKTVMRLVSDRVSFGNGIKAARVKMFHGVAYNGGVFYPTVTVNGRTEAIPIVMDLDSLIIPSEQRPVLDDHDDSTDGVIGQTTVFAVRKSNYTLGLRGVIYTEKERSKKILSASSGGHKWQLSVGVDNFQLERIEAGRTVTVNGRSFTGPISIARNAYLTDVSFVGVGGDDLTWATIEARSGRTIDSKMKRVGQECPTYKNKDAGMRRLVSAIKASRRKH